MPTYLFYTLARHQIGWQFLATVVLSEIGYRLLEEPLRRWVLARTLGRAAAQ